MDKQDTYNGPMNKTDSYYHAPDGSLIALTNRILDQHDSILKMNARLLHTLSGLHIIITTESEQNAD